jgi:hypothetical protein
MRRQAVIRVGLSRLTIAPIMSVQLVQAEDRRAMTGVSRWASASTVGGLVREALARSTATLSLRRLRRESVETLFVPPQRPALSSTTSSPTVEPPRGLLIWVTLTEAGVRLRPFASLPRGYLSLDVRTIEIDVGADDEALGRAVRRAIGTALRATLVQRIALVPLVAAEWLAARFRTRPKKSSDGLWIPPAGRG